MANYTKVFTKPYADGYEDLPSQTTPITAETLNDKDDTLEHIENYLYNNPIAEVVDNLTTNDATKALSAKQGKILNDTKLNVDDLPNSDVQTSDDGQFTTVTGGLMQSCVVDLEPIQSGSGTPSPSNVRAISGHTQVQVGNCGKNKCVQTFDNIKALNTSGSWSGNTYTYNSLSHDILIDSKNRVDGVNVNGTPSTNMFFKVMKAYLPEGNYILNGCPSNGSTSTYFLYAEGSGMTVSIDTGSGIAFTLSQKTEITVQIAVRNGIAVANKLFKPMIRIATDTDATFEPYNGYTHIIDLGGTYYGGTLDAVSGVLTIDRKFKEFNGTEAWGASGTNGFAITRTNAGLDDVLVAGTKQTPMISNMFPNSSNVNVWTNGYIGIDVGTIWIGDTNFAQFTNLATFKSFLSNNHLQIVYPLATPTTIQLDPQTLETLVGQNDVFAPLQGQTVESVEYREVMTWDDVNKAVEFTDANNLINAVKVGKTATVNIACDSFAMVGRVSEDAWDYITSEALPEEMRPQKTIHANILNILTLGGGYSITSIPCRINTTGIIEAFMLHQQTAQPYGTITYVIK